MAETLQAPSVITDEMEDVISYCIRWRDWDNCSRMPSAQNVIDAFSTELPRKLQQEASSMHDDLTAQERCNRYVSVIQPYIERYVRLDHQQQRALVDKIIRTSAGRR